MLDEEKNGSSPENRGKGLGEVLPETSTQSGLFSFIKRIIAKTISLSAAICFVILMIFLVSGIFEELFNYLYECNPPYEKNGCWDGTIRAAVNGMVVGFIVSVPLAIKFAKYISKRTIKMLGEEND